MQQYPQNTPQQSGQLSPYPQRTLPSGNQPTYPQTNPIQSSGQRFRHNFTNKQMRNYFYKPSKTYIWLMIIGAFVLLLAAPASNFGAGAFFIIVGLGLLAAGGIPLFSYLSGRPTDEQYAQWVSERFQPLYSVALQRLHIPDERQCERIIKVEGGISSLQQLTKKFPEKEITLKRLSNGSRHYSINVCMYIFLTKNDIAIYSGYINALTQNERFEDADHYYYKDIVGVSTSGPVYTPADGSFNKEFQRQGFFVRISNGEAAGTDYATKVELGDATNRVQVEGVDDVVAGLLSLLRDHNVTLAEANRMSKESY